MADIFGVRVAPDLTVLDTLIVICNQPAGQTDPSVVFNGNDYIVVWSDASSHNRDLSLKAIRVTPQGSVIDTGITFGFGASPTDIDCDGDRSLVVWSNLEQGILGRFINAQAQPEDSAIHINTLRGTDAPVRVAFDGSNYFVVWPDYDSIGTQRDIYGRFVSQDGNLQGNTLCIYEDPGNQANPDVCFNGEYYLVAWHEASGSIIGRFVTPAGQFIGDVVQLCDSNSHAKDNLRVTAGQITHLVVWSEWRNDLDIYGNCDLQLHVSEDRMAPVHAILLPTIITGSLSSYGFKDCRVFNVCGQYVGSLITEKGVYFIEQKDGALHKVIKLR